MKKVLVITSLCLLFASTSVFGSQTFNVTMTADNVYAIYYGDAVSATALLGNATNLVAADIWSPESYSLTVPDISYIYIAAWSDDAVKQGLLADFANLTLGGQVLSGDPIWEVTATGLNLGNTDPPPTLANLTTAILNANAGTNPSFGWVPNTPSPLTNSAGGIHGVTIAGIDGAARWMWYNSGLDSNPSAPFSGFNHNEYLIYRIPVVAPEPATMCLLGL
ncbi:MAG: hypothetical protein Q7T18_09125, partial [Sedimentisphaerales bacterium]|nr:hypothetical protein [Sedimentisphaerales bacterium]